MNILKPGSRHDNSPSTVPSMQVSDHPFDGSGAISSGLILPLDHRQHTDERSLSTSIVSRGNLEQQQALTSGSAFHQSTQESPIQNDEKHREGDKRFEPQPSAVGSTLPAKDRQQTSWTRKYVTCFKLQPSLERSCCTWWLLDLSRDSCRNDSHCRFSIIPRRWSVLINYIWMKH